MPGPARSFRRRAVTVLAVLATLLDWQPASPATGPLGDGRAGGHVPIVGSGSTWAFDALREWQRQAGDGGLPMTYAGIDSQAGRAEFRDGLVDFAVSGVEYGMAGAAADLPPSTDFAYLPLLGGGTGIMYNLRVDGTRVTDLRLSGDTLARIFTGVVTSWDDPAIRADNPELNLPARPIVPVVRDDFADSTAQFTRWMADRHPDLWAGLCARAGKASPCAPTTLFPVVDGLETRSGAQGVTQFVALDPDEGSITYVESSYPRDATFPVAKIRNDSGAYVEPTAENVTAALESAQIRADHTQDLAGVHRSTDPRAYPLSSYTYAIVPGAGRPGFTPEQGRSLAAFLHLTVCEGQQGLEPLGYAPLPGRLVEAALARLARIPGSTTPATCTGTSAPSTPSPAAPPVQTETRMEVQVEIPSREGLSTAVTPGALVVSVTGGPVTLPPPAPTADAGRLTTSGPLNPIRITDTRPDGSGWNLRAQVSDFTGDTGTINGANLGWEPTVAVSAPSRAVTPGPAVRPADALPPGVAAPDGVGLGAARTLADGAPGAGGGTADLNAMLTLNVPASTPPGRYTATLTLITT